jgi:cyanophycin synthetase
MLTRLYGNPAFLTLLRAAFLAGRLRERLRTRGTGFADAQLTGWHEAVWREAAEALGAEFTSLGDGFCEARRGGVATRMWKQQVMLDDPVTLALAGNKALVHRLLAKAGLAVPPHRRFALRSIRTALEFLEAQDAPCVVKPGRGTGAGAGVTTGVRSARDLCWAAALASTHCGELLIERQVAGSSYRLLLLDAELIDAIRRPAPGVVGDGRSTIAELVRAENRRRLADAHSSAAGPLVVDLDCRLTLRAAGLSLRSVPAAGQRVLVKAVSNQAGDADNEAVRNLIGPALVRQAAAAAAAVGARLAGVDVITPDPALSLEEAGGVINEVNTTPGIRYHYLVRNADQRLPVAIPILRSILDARERRPAGGVGREPHEPVASAHASRDR